MTVFTIEIVSDTVCPWCYVGKKKLEQAISTYQTQHAGEGDTFVTTWKPFYLNPDAPMKGIDKMGYYKSKFGEERTNMIFERLSQIGTSVGINFKFGGLSGNTRTSHRLIQLGKSKSPETQTAVVSALFAAYFENEQDITSKEVLLNAGVKAGLEEKEVKEWLDSDKGGPEVDREVEEAKREGVSGVPNFTVNGRYEVGGAQDAGVFLRLFERVKGEEGGKGGVKA